MSMTNSGVVGLLSEKMSYLGRKLSVHAQNVANADTPGYKAMELKAFVPFSQALKEASSGMQVTDPRHIVPASMAGVNASTKRADSFETVPSGNSVDLEQQMMEVSSTTVDYQAMVSVYHKFVGLMKAATGR